MTTADFLALLIETLNSAIPARANQPAVRAAELTLARQMFETLRPADALQAAAAVRAIVAHFVAMDSFARAAKPDLSDEKVLRLYGKALAASRMASAGLRGFDKLRQSARTTAAPAAPLPRPQRSEPPVVPTPRLPGLPMRAPRNTDLRASSALASVRPTILPPGLASGTLATPQHGQAREARTEQRQ